MSIIGKLHDLVSEANKIFPTASLAKLLPDGRLPRVGELPLLTLLNDPAMPSPTFPLSIAAIEEIGKEAGTDDLKALNEQLVNFLKSGKIEDLRAFFGDLGHLADEAVDLVAKQVVIGRRCSRSSRRSIQRISTRFSRRKANTFSAISLTHRTRPKERLRAS